MPLLVNIPVLDLLSSSHASLKKNATAWLCLTFISHLEQIIARSNRSTY